MKTIEAAAMTAIEAGEAIVTGAVEIIPRGSIVSAAVNVDANSFTGTLAARTTTITDFSASDTVILSKPKVVEDSRMQWDAWSAYDDDETPTIDPPVAGRTWDNRFSVYGNNGGADTLLFEPVLDTSNLYATQAEAYLALAAQLPVEFTGYDTYKVVVINDPNPPDNRNGISLLLRSAAVGSADPIRVWGGYGPISIDSQTYQGVGDRGLAQQSAGAVGGYAQGLVLTLSGIEPHALALLDGEEVKGAAVVVRRLIFASDGKTLLDSAVFDRGRVDTVETVETIGAGAAIQLAVESAARGLGSSGARMRSDADQRMINPSDGYFKHTAFAGEKSLYWGGRKPNRVGGSSGGFSGLLGGFFGSTQNV